MESKNILVLLVAVLALVFLLTGVSATHENIQGLVHNFAKITSVEVNGVESAGALSGAAINVGAFAGETLPVRVTFQALDNASDVRLKVWISGEESNAASSNRFDVITGSTYSRLVAVPIPFDIEPEEEMRLYISLESRDGGLPTADIVRIKAQRESYIVEILDANMPTEIRAGENLVVDVVLKNRGRQEAEDTFVRAKIPTLGVEGRAYFGDLSPVDQDDPDKEDSAQRRIVLNIPRSAKAGVYVVELEAYNSDSATTLSKKVSIAGASEADSAVISRSASKTFGVGEKETYSLTLVNSGDRVRIYELVGESSSENLEVSVDDSVVVVPAGESKTVDVNARALKAGKYTFAVNVISNGDLVKQESFTANVDGGKRTAGNTTVLLTVILAIIFVVLLVVLIVLLTRKPEKEEFGESYY